MKLFCVAFVLACSVGTVSAADRPNILLFTADDLHAESLGVYGGKPTDLTPNLDAFAAECLLFNRAHVNVAICAPCRAVIATGRYSHRSGAMGFMPAREDVPDIVTRLKAAGYHTGILGKVGHSTPKKSMEWDYPMLAAFLNRDDRAKVDEVLVATYGPKKDERATATKNKSAKNKR